MARNEVLMTTESSVVMNLGRLGFRLGPNNRKPTKKLVPVTTLHFRQMRQMHVSVRVVLISHTWYQLFQTFPQFVVNHRAVH